MSADEPRYTPVYRETDETSEYWRKWLVNVESRNTEPSELSTITDVCACARCTAVLLDAAGIARGSVDSAGNVRLT